MVSILVCRFSTVSCADGEERLGVGQVGLSLAQLLFKEGFLALVAGLSCLIVGLKRGEIVLIGGHIQGAEHIALCHCVAHLHIDGQNLSLKCSVDCSLIAC